MVRGLMPSKDLKSWVAHLPHPPPSSGSSPGSSCPERRRLTALKRRGRWAPGPPDKPEGDGKWGEERDTELYRCETAKGWWRIRPTTAVFVIMLLFGWTANTYASGPSSSEPWYVDQYEGDHADLLAWFNGRLGIVKRTAPRPMRYIDWRLLHAQAVGEATGNVLATPCCNDPTLTTDYSGGSNVWIKARNAVTGANDTSYIETERPGPDNTSIPNCFPDAFKAAAATLTDRAGRYGPKSATVLAWVAAQSAVFKACHDPSAMLPPPIANMPPWLSMDRDYQAAALALYAGRNDDAAVRFTAIARDARSPWRDSGLYLAVRAEVRQALIAKTPSAYAKAHAAIAALAAAPAGALGRDRLPALNEVVAFREDPRGFLIKLTRQLDAAAPSPHLASVFRDYTDLGEAATAKPEALDWIDTLRAIPPSPLPSDSAAADQAIARYESSRRSALAHATQRWRASHDAAWLVAALSLIDAQDVETPALLTAAGSIPPSAPGWLSLQHDIIRLTLIRTPPEASRRRLDTILARTDLSVSDRNIFASQRAQVASSLDDFARFALRHRVCGEADYPNTWDATTEACVRQRWDIDQIQSSGIYDGVGDKGSLGWGEDALAIIDRAPLADRISLSRNSAIPVKLRLDVALTSYGRAVLLQDDAAIDGLAHDLEALLPIMAKDFHDIQMARPGADKRFAEFVVLAKIPGIRTDLIDYERPEGAHVADFQRYWTDWIILKRPGGPTAPPPLVRYQSAGANFQSDFQDGVWPDAATDLTCLGECGRGAAPLRTPEVFAAGAIKAAAERALYFKTDHADDKPEPTPPPGAVDAWDEMLTYAHAHPTDPRIPETLYWLVHVGHYGGSHNHSGKRAFELLHSRYPESIWAKKTPYYND